MRLLTRPFDPGRTTLRVAIPLAVLFFLLGTAAVQSPLAVGQSSAVQDEMLQDFVVGEADEQELGSADIAAASQWASNVTPVDWLGPLAPVALSPFFGITLLSGLAIWGPEFISDNSLLSSATPLKSQTLFWIFLGLTVLTSVPRLSKVSKPLAQAVDFVETYSVIIILLVIKFMVARESESVEPQVVLQAGIFSFTLDTLLALAMVINVIVINAVKFFFEFLIWLTPIPALDALFEICNKLACVSLMGLYAFSPTLATIVNLILLTLAAIIFRWASRRVRFYRTMMLDPILSWLFSGWGQPKHPQLVVFPRTAMEPFPAKGRLLLTHDEEGWMLSEARWFLPKRELRLVRAECQLRIRCGRLTNDLILYRGNAGETTLIFSRRYWGQIAAIAELVGAEIDIDTESQQAMDSAKAAKTEFA